MSNRAARHIVMGGSGTGAFGSGTVLVFRSAVNFSVSIGAAEIDPSSGYAVIDWGFPDGVHRMVRRNESWDYHNAPSCSFPAGEWRVRVSDTLTSLAVNGFNVATGTAQLPGSVQLVAVESVGARLTAVAAYGFSASSAMEDLTALRGSNIRTFLGAGTGAGAFAGSALGATDLMWTPYELTGEIGRECFRGCTDLVSLRGMNVTVRLPKYRSEETSVSFRVASGTIMWPANTVEIRLYDLKMAPGCSTLTVDWGDETVTEYTVDWQKGVKSPLSHAYNWLTFQTGTVYTVTVSDTVESFEFAVYSARETLDAYGNDVYTYHGLVNFGSYPITFNTAGSMIRHLGCHNSSSNVAGFETNVQIAGGIHTIGASAFQGCTSLTDLGTLSSVVELKDHAFESCTSLASYPPNDGKCGVLYEDPGGSQWGRLVGHYAFANCSSLRWLTSYTPTVHTMFLDGAFQGTGITTLAGLSAETCYLDVTKSDGTVVRESLVSLWNGPFSPVDVTVEVTTASGRSTVVVTLANGWSQTLNLSYAARSVTFVTGLRCDAPQSKSSSYQPGLWAGPYCFARCTGLTDLFGLPYSVRDYATGLFGSCTGLTDIRDPYDVARGLYADSPAEYFITSPELRAGIDKQPSFSAILDGSYDNSFFTRAGVSELKTYGDGCFQGCDSLQTARLYGVSAIGEAAFGGCENLKTLWFSPYRYPIELYIPAPGLSEGGSAQVTNRRQQVDLGPYDGGLLWQESRIMSIGARAFSVSGVPVEQVVNEYGERVIRIDSRVLPYMDANALTDAFWVQWNVADYPLPVVNGTPNLVVQFRSLVDDEGIRHESDAWATDTATTSKLTIQEYMNFRSPASSVGVAISNLELGIRFSYPMFYSLTAGPGIHAHVGTVFFFPISYQGEYIGVIRTALVGWQMYPGGVVEWNLKYKSSSDEEVSNATTIKNAWFSKLSTADSAYSSLSPRRATDDQRLARIAWFRFLNTSNPEYLDDNRNCVLVDSTVDPYVPSNPTHMVASGSGEYWGFNCPRFEIIGIELIPDTEFEHLLVLDRYYVNNSGVYPSGLGVEIAAASRAFSDVFPSVSVLTQSESIVKGGCLLSDLTFEAVTTRARTTLSIGATIPVDVKLGAYQDPNNVVEDENGQLVTVTVPEETVQATVVVTGVTANNVTSASSPDVRDWLRFVFTFEEALPIPAGRSVSVVGGTVAVSPAGDIVGGYWPLTPNEITAYKNTIQGLLAS